MSLLITPNSHRDRKNINAIVPPNFKDILNLKTGPRIQFQYNDKNDKCIGNSMVLIPENDELEGLIFVPRAKETDEGLIVPEIAYSIVVFGQQGVFSCKNDLDLTYNKPNHNSPPSLLDRPYNFFLAKFYLKNGKRDSNMYVKDIINYIEFSDGYFKRLETIEPINLIK